MAYRTIRPNTVFFRGPRVGGRSVEEWIKKHCGGYRIRKPGIRGGSHFLPSDIGEFPGIYWTIVRNPWDRMSSYYHHFAQNHGYEHNFKTFLVEAKITRYQCNDYARLCDGHIEYYNLRKIQQMYEVDEPFPNIHETKRPNNDDIYTPETKDLVAKLYDRDVNQYGYEYEGVLRKNR